jgi:hypothetical protein
MSPPRTTKKRAAVLVFNFVRPPGEKVRGTFARPCLHLCERAKQRGDKVYCSCKEANLGLAKLKSLVRPPGELVWETSARLIELVYEANEVN